MTADCGAAARATTSSDTVGQLPNQPLHGCLVTAECVNGPYKQPQLGVAVEERLTALWLVGCWQGGGCKNGWTQ